MSASQPKRLRFHIMIDRETRQIARRLRDATQLRLFLLLPSFLRWDAWHPIDEARIAAEPEITPEELNKALAGLVLHGLVLRTTASLSGSCRRSGAERGHGGRYRQTSPPKPTGRGTRTPREHRRLPGQADRADGRLPRGQNAQLRGHRAKETGGPVDHDTSTTPRPIGQAPTTLSAAACALRATRA